MASKRTAKRLSVPPEPARTSEPSAPPAELPWRPPARLSRRGVAVLVAVMLAINLPVLHRLMRGAPPAQVQLPFVDEFSSGELSSGGADTRYFSTGGDWKMREGILIAPAVRNNALWLRAALPDDVQITLDARALVQEGDVRVELFGNGTDPLSGYRLVLSPYAGGARGTLFRLAENGASWRELESRAMGKGPLQSGLYDARTAVRVEGVSLPIKTNEPQRWTIERHGDTIRWGVNGRLVLDFTDPLPLRGAGHDRIGLSGGDWDVLYDRLSVTRSTGPLAVLAEAPRPPPPPPAGPFRDDFDRAELGSEWRPTAPEAVRVERGALTLQGAHNHPVWLSRPLPENAIIELDAWSDSAEGDLKVEVWGDGSSAHEGDLRAAYTATGYVFVMGGWRNTRSVIARREEHGPAVAERTDVRVEPGRRYHWRIGRKGGRLTWEIDGKPFLALNDPNPLDGPQQAYFAFSDWEARVHFDNLTIVPSP